MFLLLYGGHGTGSERKPDLKRASAGFRDLGGENCKVVYKTSRGYYEIFSGGVGRENPAGSAGRRRGGSNWYSKG